MQKSVANVLDSPCQYLAAGPVEHGTQRDKATLPGEVRDVGRPDVIGMGDTQSRSRYGSSATSEKGNAKCSGENLAERPRSLMVDQQTLTRSKDS